jgi:hypothetical protein
VQLEKMYFEIRILLTVQLLMLIFYNYQCTMMRWRKRKIIIKKSKELFGIYWLERASKKNDIKYFNTLPF